eukprot:Clim_evm12s38 gene=Clim_evmTU12s38
MAALRRTTQRKLHTNFRKLGSNEDAKVLQRFFKQKDAPSDIFLGIRMPVIRKWVSQHSSLAEREWSSFITSNYHEERMAGLLLIVKAFEREKEEIHQQRLFDLYVAYMPYINNWDLVDCTCRFIVGPHLQSRNRSILNKWAVDSSLWVRRIAIVSTLHFIMRCKDCTSSYEVAELLLGDKEDLIHKATGWVLREAWKKEPKIAEQFLRTHRERMSRTTLRYAIERMPPELRVSYLTGKF